MKGLYSSVGLASLWGASLVKKMARAVPFYSAAFVVVFIISQLLLILAFLLPIKVLVLLGSESIPNYVPMFLSRMGRDYLIYLFVGFAIICFVFHFLFGFVEAVLVKKGGGLLLVKAGKQLVAHVHNKAVVDAYRTVLTSCAFFIFFGFSFIALFLIYPVLAVVVLLLLAFCFFMLPLCQVFGISAQFLEKNLNFYFTLSSGFIFFSSFLFIIVDFLHCDPPSLLVALVSLLMIRQGVQRLFGGISEFIKVYSRRAQVEPLFFLGKQFALESKFDSQDSVLLKIGGVSSIASRAMEKLVGVSVSEAEILRLGARDVVGVSLLASNEACYLVKIFLDEAKALAFHEQLLLSSEQGLLVPSPEWVGTVEVDSVICHVFRWGGYVPVPRRDVGKAILHIFSSLADFELPSLLVSGYIRSHSLLVDRLEGSWFSSVSEIATATDREYIDHISCNIELIKQIVSGMPLCVVARDLTDETLFVRDGRYVGLSWGRWALDSVGVGWPVLDKEQFAEAVASVPSLSDTPVEQLYLVATLDYYERLIARGDFFKAIDLIKAIRGSLEVVTMSYGGSVSSKDSCL